jgi:hypothetical protein
MNATEHPISMHSTDIFAIQASALDALAEEIQKMQRTILNRVYDTFLSRPATVADNFDQWLSRQRPAWN